MFSYFTVSLVVGFFATDFLAGETDFLATGFATAFLATTGFTIGAGVLSFLVVFSLTPAFFARADNLDLRLAAVFFLIKPFLTAVSISLWAVLSPAADGFAIKALVASFIFVFVTTFRSRRTTVCLARLMADFIIGIFFL